MDDKIIEAAEFIHKNFGDVSDESSKYEKAKVAILPAPYDRTVTYRKGTENGPRAIIEASGNIELYDDELGKDTYRIIGIHTARELEVQNLSSEAMIKEICKKVGEAVGDEKFPVIIGGEHSVSIGAIKSLQRIYKDLSVLILDAHLDLRDSYGDSKFNHACVGRRILETAPIVEVGSRSMSKEEKNFLPNPSINIFNVYDILDMPNWKEKIRDALSDTVYISIDLDVFDPSIMPSVGTPAPGGLGWYETLDLLKFIISNKNIVGLDVVELCPIKDIVGPDLMTAKLIYRLLGYIFLINNKPKPKKEENSKKEEKPN